jgi:hypothetical protein
MIKLGTKLKMMLGTVLMVASMISVFGLVLPVSAACLCDGTDTSAQCGVECANPNPNDPNLTDMIKNIVNLVIFVVGIIAVIMVILGGIQYSTSQGDPAKVKKAKDTILYGIIGLVVAILAFAIVNFVLAGLAGS